MKLVITLRHLSLEFKYTNMPFGWRVSHITISVIVTKSPLDRLVFEVLVLHIPNPGVLQTSLLGLLLTLIQLTVM